MSFISDPNSVATTDLNAYSRNLKAINRFTGDTVSLMAVIKSNAYGHGMVECAEAAEGAGASMLGVCYASEGVMLRKAGATLPILALGPESTESLPVMVENDITVALNSFFMLDSLAGLLERTEKTYRVHIKVDSGMGRTGIPINEAAALTEAAWKTKGIAVEGIFTHFPCADEEKDDYNRAQIASFLSLLETLEHRGIRPRIAHMCSSAGTLKYPEAHFDLVRPGIMTYGLLPYPGAWSVLPLEPVLSWKSAVTFVKDVPTGFPVSYGGTFVTKRPSRLATVPVGYGHGYRRFLSNKGRAVIGGCYVPIAGRICMDQTVFDVTDAGDVRVGDPVTLIGSDSGARVTVEEIADCGGTITHEIVTGITGRVSRAFVKTA